MPARRIPRGRSGRRTASSSGSPAGARRSRDIRASSIAHLPVASCVTTTAADGAASALSGIGAPARRAICAQQPAKSRHVRLGDLADKGNAASPGASSRSKPRLDRRAATAFHVHVTDQIAKRPVRRRSRVPVQTPASRGCCAACGPPCAAILLRPRPRSCNRRPASPPKRPEQRIASAARSAVMIVKRSSS